MPTSYSVIEGAYLRDILDQPRALEDTLASLDCNKALESIADRVARGSFQRIVLTGMGASYHALHPLHLKLVSHSLASSMVETSELLHYQNRMLGAKTLLVIVSQSGRSAEIVKLLGINRKRCPVIAVTNTADTRLATQADAVILTRAGVEFSVSCKTYTASLLALEWLGSLLCHDDLIRSRRSLKTTMRAVQRYLSSWQNKVRELTKVMTGVQQLFLVGRGTSLAAVGTGALIVKESTHFAAEGMSSAAFRHGPMEMLARNILVLVFSGDKKTRALNTSLIKEIQAQEGRAESIGDNAHLDSCRIASSGLRPLLEILPVQMLTLAIAALRGRQAGQFTRISKVTTTE
jgi:glutamine---fructose-6-phosphate transaminase (isomerizing)